MKQFLKHGLLFFIIFFITEKSAYLLIFQAANREYDKRLEYVLEGEINKDLIVLGSSKGASNILAGQLQSQTGFETYNLSYEGSNVIFHNFILKTLLKFNSIPKKVVLVLDTPYEFIEEQSLKFRNDRLYPLSKYNYINAELIKQKKKNWVSWFLFLNRLNRSNIEFKDKQPFHFNPLDSSGSRPYIVRNNKKKLEYSNKIKEYDKTLELDDKILAFKSIQDLCSKNEIELILVIPPNFNKYNSSFTKRVKNMLILENKLFVYDTLNDIYMDKQYYNDYSHLFKNGAKIFTSEISEFINSNK